MSRQADTQTLVESFCALADEVQNLTDRKTILEHKLRFAAEQYQQLADKYAPTAPEVSETLANLQVPPDEHKLSIPSSYVPLPKRGQAGCNQHQIALLIRDGRRVAQQLRANDDDRTNRDTSDTRDNRNDVDGHGSGGSSKETSSGTAITTMSIIMEQDFTVEGKKGMLACPFSAMKREQQLLRQQQQLEQENQQLHITGGGDDAQRDDDHDGADTADIVAAAPVDSKTSNRNGNRGHAPSHADDPICAALAEESSYQRVPSSGGGAAPRCPIRFLDQHSPEEVAHYVETHKHQLPRSHAICLKRYNKSEQQIRKIDAKYGNLVNMISGLGQFHQPMLASAEPAPGGTDNGGGPGGVILGVDERDEEEIVDRAKLHKDSHERVKRWANGVSASGEEADGEDTQTDNANAVVGDKADGQGESLRGRRRSMAYSGGRESSGSGGDNTDPERESHFDRPLKEVRLGESPSRPWGIAVPITSISHDAAAQPPLSPPAAPVRMPSPMRAAVHSPTLSPSKPVQQQQETKPVRKCPFDHSKFGLGIAPPPGHAPIAEEEGEGNDETAEVEAAETPRPDAGLDSTPQPEPFTPVKPQMPKLPQPLSQPLSQPPQHAEPKMQPQQTFTQPAFVNFPQQTAAQAGANAGVHSGAAPQMVFTGPVFIGYPMEQAAQFLQMYHNPQGR
ncbi:hypothetical protein SCUCBS95973_005880 [Sporothrix curviconia]|uniref:Uncharacterized protein n=1 Tax=Sporothrix curviconia TaxID=1260050 RepID=A0ABP0C0L1_9PEZI